MSATPGRFICPVQIAGGEARIGHNCLRLPVVDGPGLSADGLYYNESSRGATVQSHEAG